MKSARLLIAAALVSLSATPPFARAVESFQPRICELPKRNVLADGEDGRLVDGTLLHASLVAGGGCQGAEAKDLAKRFHDWSTGQAEVGQPAETEADRTRRIFERLHAELLTGNYQARCSDPAVTLRSGDYNCVTATILYIEALRVAGVKAEPYAMVGHVFCRVGGEQFDVETTCERWFGLSHEDANAAAERVTRIRAQARKNARKLSDAELIAKIYYNRGVACFRGEEFEQGMLLTRHSLRLDPHDEIARGNIMAGLNNWGLCLCGRAEFTQAAEKFEELRNLDPNYATLEENEAHLNRLWAEKRLQSASTQGSEVSTPAG